jgi:hypothetical protein
MRSRWRFPESKVIDDGSIKAFCSPIHARRSEPNAVIARCRNEARSGGCGAKAKGRKRTMTASRRGGAKSLRFVSEEPRCAEARTEKLDVFATGPVDRLQRGNRLRSSFHQAE